MAFKRVIDLPTIDAVTGADYLLIENSEGTYKVPASDVGGGGSITTEVILDKLKGVEADPERIGVEYMPNDIVVDRISLANASEITLGVGEFSGDADGNAVIGDGVTLGGRKLMLDLPIPSQHALVYVNSFPPATPYSFVKIGEIKIPSIAVGVNMQIILGFDLIVQIAGFSNLTDLAICFKGVNQTPPKEVTLPAAVAPGSANRAHKFEGIVNLIANSIGDPETLNLISSDKTVCEIYPSTFGPLSAASVDVVSDAYLHSESGPLVSGVGATLEIGVWIKTSDVTLTGQMYVKGKWTYVLYPAP